MQNRGRPFGLFTSLTASVSTPEGAAIIAPPVEGDAGVCPVDDGTGVDVVDDDPDGTGVSGIVAGRAVAAVEGCCCVVG